MPDTGIAACDQLNLKLEVKTGAEPGSFEGYGAVFGNCDRDGDVVEKGAFAESLRVRKPALLWQHNQKEPIGRFETIVEDDKGLRVKGKLSLKGRGAEAYELLQMGALDGLSIGFMTKEASRDAKTGTRTIHKADLMEISLVTFPANEMARIDAVKAADSINDERAFERFLREQGFSRTRAKAITSKGFKSPMIEKQTEISENQEIAEMILGLEAKTAVLQSSIAREQKGTNSRRITVKKNRLSRWFGFDPAGSQPRDNAKINIFIESVPGRSIPKLKYKVRYRHPDTGNITVSHEHSTTRFALPVAGTSKNNFITRLVEDPISIQFKALEEGVFSVSTRWSK